MPSRAMRIASVCTFFAVFGVAAPASATPSFPKGIQKQLALESAPPCTVCHATALGGKGTVTRDFGLAMRERGLVAYDDSGLKVALAKAESDHVDSDHDGTPDTQALKEGKNPNDGTVIDPNVAGREKSDAGPSASSPTALDPAAPPADATGSSEDAAVPADQGCSLSPHHRDWTLAPVFAALGVATFLVRRARRTRRDGRGAARSTL